MQRLSLSLIEFYQMFICPLMFNGVCKYEVSCSEYTKQVIREAGVVKGSLMGLKRIWSCK